MTYDQSPIGGIDYGHGFKSTGDVGTEFPKTSDLLTHPTPYMIRHHALGHATHFLMETGNDVDSVIEIARVFEAYLKGD